MRRAPTEPVEIKKVGGSSIRIKWGDDHLSQYQAALLRAGCPCATCVDEWTGQRRVSPNPFPTDLAINKVELVGRYALHFTFSDSHDTGIYTFEYLRRICSCERCQGQTA